VIDDYNCDFKDEAVNTKHIAQVPSARYRLEGSVRKSANRMRITTKLVDAATSAYMWADRFDVVLEDLFRLQDEVTASVIGAIAPKLEQA
jgi:adenylate cyclase